MSYIPGMNQDWGASSSTPANAGTPRSTGGRINPLTGAPYQKTVPAIAGGITYTPQPGGPMKLLGFDDGGSVPEPTVTPDPTGAGSNAEEPDTQGAIPNPGDAIPTPSGDTAQPDINNMLNSAIDTYQYGLQKYGMGGQPQGADQSTFAANADQMRPSTNVEDDRNGQIYPNTLSKVVGQGVMNFTKNMGAVGNALGGTQLNPTAPNEGGDMGGPVAPPQMPPNMAANIPAIPAGPGGDQPNPNPFPTKTPNPAFGQRFSAAGQYAIPAQS